jgi:hypothetical protein
MGWNSAQYSSNSQPWPGVVGKVELESRCTQVTEPSSMLTARLYMEPQGDESKPGVYSHPLRCRPYRIKKGPPR